MGTATQRRNVRCFIWMIAWLSFSCAASKPCTAPDSYATRQHEKRPAAARAFPSAELKGEQKNVFITYGVPDRAVRLEFGVTRWTYCRLKSPLLIEFDAEGLILGTIDAAQSCPQLVSDR